MNLYRQEQISLKELNYDKKIGYSKIISLIKNEDSYQEYIVDVKKH